jgi:prophage antirepressor-like protein/phage anti-repressor protein
MINDPLPLTYLGRRFNTTESDDQMWLRIDELGLALAVAPPEQALLDLHQEHFAQFSERLSILVPVETPEGPRLMRAFNLLGAYVLSTFVPNPQAQQFRRWLLETLIYFQIDIRREIRRLTEEDRRMREHFEAAIQALAEEVRALREAQAGQTDRSWFEGEFRRWHDAQARTATAVKELSARIGKAAERRPAPSSEDVTAVLRACLDPLVDGMAGLYEQLEVMAAAAGDGAGPAAALGTGVPVLTLSSQYSLSFHYEGERLTVLVWNGAGPWFFVRELARLLAPPEEDLANLDTFLAARVPEKDRGTAKDEGTGDNHPIVSETGLVLLFRAWSEFMLERDKKKLGRWIADQVIPSAHSLRLKEAELAPETQPADFPLTPTAVVADRLFKVWAGEIDGRPAMLVNARDLHKFLGFRRAFVDWFEERRRWAGFRSGIHFVRVFVHVRQYDYYLTLDAAGSLLCQESHPKAVAAREYLLEVARERGTVIEGVATVVRDTGTAVTVTHCFDKKWNVRTVTRADGKTWWVAPDVCEALGLGNPTMALKPLDDDEKQVIDFTTLSLTEGRENQSLRRFDPKSVNIISESGLYTLILRCRDAVKPSTVPYRFRRWVTKEVLPTLRKTGRFDVHGAAPGHATPPHEPLIFPFKAGAKAIPVRVEIKNGQPWFAVFDLAPIVDEPYDDPRPVFAGLPECYRDLRPSPDGESAVLWVNEAGLAYYLGARPHKPGAERLRDWLLKKVLPSLHEKMGTAPTAPFSSDSMPVLRANSPVPPEAYYTHHDPLYLAFVALADLLSKAEEPQKARRHALSANYGRFLAWLWRNSPAGDWLDVRNRTRFAAAVGIDRRSLSRVLARAVSWDLVEQSPAPEADLPEAWPTRVRLRKDQVLAALDEAGLASSARENGHG